jgi:hypothetical protein
MKMTPNAGKAGISVSINELSGVYIPHADQGMIPEDPDPSFP